METEDHGDVEFFSVAVALGGELGVLLEPEYRSVSCLPLAQPFVSEVPRHSG